MRRRVSVGLAKVLQQPREPGQGLEQVAVAALEERAPLGWDRLGILEVLLEQNPCVTGIDGVDVRHRHHCLL